MKSARYIKLERLFRGYVTLKIDKTYAEHFMNLCKSKGIVLWNVKELSEEKCVREKQDAYESKKYLNGSMYASDYLRIKAISRKIGYFPKIDRKIGIPFYIKKHRKEKVLLISFLLFWIILQLCSGYIWKIDAFGGYVHTPEQIMDFLETHGIYEGCKKRVVDCAAIEDLIRQEFNDIGWVSAELKGTDLKLKWTETRQPVADIAMITDGFGNRFEKSSGDMIAMYDCIVTEIVAEKGTARVKCGDVVKKGDVLIEGIVQIYGDDNLLIEERNILARGCVKLKTIVPYQDDFQRKYLKKIFTGNIGKSIRLDCFQHKIFSYNYSNFYENCDIIDKMGQLCLGESFYLPIQYRIKEKREFYYESAYLSQEEAKLQSKERLERELASFEAVGATLDDINVEIEIDEMSCKTFGTITIEGEFWSYREKDAVGTEGETDR